MTIFIQCPTCGDNGPHTILVLTRDPVIVYCVNEFCPGGEFEVPREEIDL